MPRVGSRHRCTTCQMSGALCLCPLIPRLQTRTRVVVLMHYLEAKTSTNTARLAHLMLPTSEIRLRGLAGRPMDDCGIVTEDRQPLLLYPSPDSRELAPEWVASLDKPVTLIVPDGSWRQCQKVGNREPVLRQVPRFRLRPGPPSEYRLRIEPHAHSVSTLEAIARALDVLEGPVRGPEIRASMERVFRIMVERTLWSRGKLRDEECLSLPEAARRQRAPGDSSGS